MPSELREELFGDANEQPSPGGDLPPVALNQSFLSQIENMVSKRVLLIISAVSLGALVVTIIGSNSVINSFDEGVTPTLPAMSPLRVSTLAGIWLGVDHSQGSPGVPVTYLFTRPNWVIVTEPETIPATGSTTAPSGVPAVVAEANYGLSGSTLSMQPIAATNPQLLPGTAKAAVNGNTVTISDLSAAGTAPIVLTRSAAIAGTWQASGSGKYEFNSNGKLTITVPGAKPQTSSYTIAGNALRVTPIGGAPQTWNFTFDGKNLLLYMPDPANPSGAPNFSMPTILSRA